MAEFQTTIVPSSAPFVINGSGQRFITPTIVPQTTRFNTPIRTPGSTNLSLACGQSGTAQIKQPDGTYKDVQVVCGCKDGQKGCIY